jgi:CDP-4-dehydro-6-deoxyglucose reductase, E3
MMREAKVVDARMISSEVREITLDGGADFRFKPGQWVSFRMHDAVQGKLTRAYSIASAPRDDARFEIAVTRVSSGPASGLLHSAQIGACLRMSEAQGEFALVGPDRPMVMVATGTGVSPLRSMLLDAAGRGQRLAQTRLLFGARGEQDLIYRQDFLTLQDRQPSFRYVPTLSRAAESWNGLRGYVQAHVGPLVEQLGGDTQLYICGLSEMIREVRAVARGQLGFSRDRIHTERFD